MKRNRDVVIFNLFRVFLPVLSSIQAMNKARNKFLKKEEKIRSFAVILFCCRNCL